CSLNVDSITFLLKLWQVKILPLDQFAGRRVSGHEFTRGIKRLMTALFLAAAGLRAAPVGFPDTRQRWAWWGVLPLLERSALTFKLAHNPYFHIEVAMKVIVFAYAKENHTAPVKWALEQAGYQVACWGGLSWT